LSVRRVFFLTRPPGFSPGPKQDQFWIRIAKRAGGQTVPARKPPSCHAPAHSRPSPVCPRRFTASFNQTLLTRYKRRGTDDLKPIQQVGKITVPKIFIAGTLDHDTPLPESQALFAAAAKPKQLWLVAGADHVDLHAFARAEYERRTMEFRAANLK
jgi:pimeloyl-ACP methyl ester carboxylesterase